MFWLIGIFFILLGVLFDEGSTLLLFIRGYGMMETNPIFLNYGGLVYLSLTVMFYILLIWFWGKMINIYDILYKSKGTGYKLYDIFIFMFCFIIIFMAATKIELGYNNVQILAGTFVHEEYYQDNLIELENYQRSHPEEFTNERTADYYLGTITSISYLKMLFIMLSSFIFFRVGYKVMPYQYARS